MGAFTKKITCTTLLIATVIVMSGCGKGTLEEDKKSPPQPSSKGPTSAPYIGTPREPMPKNVTGEQK